VAQTRIYLAGPEVFLPNAHEVGAAKVALCAARGFVGLYPGAEDAPLPADRSAWAGAIYRRCVAMMRSADIIIANLTPFRGPSADVGTVFELGYMAALGKPCFAYSSDGDSLLDRTRRLDARIRHDATQDAWIDHEGLTVEDFDQFDNLMLPGGLTAPVARRVVPASDRFTDLAAFRACLDLIGTRP